MKQKEVIPAGKNWTKTDVRRFGGSVFDRVGKDWMLITAGNVEADKGAWNAMTASWGGLGVLWGVDVAFMFIRPSRYTFSFADAAGCFTLSFFDERYRAALDLFGSKSGRDTDKAAAAGLTPVVFAGGHAGSVVGFEEAAGIMVCQKLYTHDFAPAGFLEPFIENCYHGTDYHRMFIGRVETLLVKAHG